MWKINPIQIYLAVFLKNKHEFKLRILYSIFYINLRALIIENIKDVFMSVPLLRLGVRCSWSQSSDGGRGASCFSLDCVYLQEAVLHAVCVDLRPKK